MTITHQDEFTTTHRANTTLLDELAGEAQAYLQLLARHRAGEDVTGELYGSVVHLGTHAGLLGERLIDEAELADALENGLG
ncbi:hypothetical protein [Deinococcus marmoris]|uniref:Uncharacterized protein n=1 Tax=Deinococcus marmoris TaxID=249408 RepID=A0A1U7P560_9DEIO|nr:hypothetical protein [Deinococcus marmoris]OLV20307.1 hypothetical protein BOO71_0000121 [Deinococcus marmoris]